MDTCYKIRDDQLPIIYRDEYNVNFMGVEKLHPFDARKWRHIFKYLKKAGILSEQTVVEPKEASKETLLLVHSEKYINSLKSSLKVARIAEVPLLMLVPNYFVQKAYLRAMRFQTGGTILAGQLSLEKGWAINIGGGFHHCSADKGGGFCPYADITLMVQHLLKNNSNKVKKAMIVDLDAHQGNGYGRDFINNPNVFILDAYNKQIYPHDTKAAKAISCPILLEPFTEDEEYLTKVRIYLEKSIRSFNPDIVIYNAGTDILEGDRLGLLSISASGIIQRDEMVFAIVRGQRIPIVMLTSGGYLMKTAKIISNSIINLKNLGLLSIYKS